MNYERIRKLIIISLFIDDNLFERFVLKGGNALLVHDIDARASLDIDVSMENCFAPEEEIWVKETLDRTLNETFLREGLAVIDVKLEKKPKTSVPEKRAFWGGYKLLFKIVTKENLERFQAGEISKQQLQQLAFAIDSVASHSKTFTVDISNYEFCGQKEEREIEGFPIYVYTPIAIIYEKLRAICQQLPEYQKYVGTKKNAPRPRDFFDIFSVLEKHRQLDPAIYKKLYEERNLIDLANIFSLKKVPLQFLARIRDQQDYHEQDFVSVKDTVDQSKVRLEDFSFYFYFTVQIAEKLLEELTRLSILDNTASID